MTIDINCDMGEGILVRTASGSVSADELIMPYVTSANIACGAHAGSPDIIAETIALAKKYGVGIGAHPGFPDWENFGRIALDMTKHDLIKSLSDQIRLVVQIARKMGEQMQHVKPHGALYNVAVKDMGLANLIAAVVQDIDPSLTLVALPASALEKAAHAYDLQFAAEAFADRAYNDDGTLVARDQPGAVIQDTEVIIERALTMVTEKRVVSINMKSISLLAHTICIHGDNPGAPDFVKKLLGRLHSEGVQVKTFAAKPHNRYRN